MLPVVKLHLIVRTQETISSSATAPITELIGNVKELQQRLDYKENAWAAEKRAIQEKHKVEIQQLRKIAQEQSADTHRQLELKDDTIEELQAQTAKLGRDLEVKLQKH